MTTTANTRDQQDTPLRTPPSLRMTEEEFLAWCDEDTHAEWVDGEVIMMAPASFWHNDILWWICTLLRHYVDRKDLGVVAFDAFVRLAKPRRQIRGPDIIFVAKGRTNIIRDGRFVGPPDLLMEIVSPDSLSRDWREKYEDYQAAGVREYWVVDPASHVVEAYALSAKGKYARIKEKDGRLASTVVPGWYLKPAWLWQEKRPNVLDLLGELGIR